MPRSFSSTPHPLNTQDILIQNTIGIGTTSAQFDLDATYAYSANIANQGGKILSTGSAILGGADNTISGDFDVIAGGGLNNISGCNYSFIGGGSGIDITGSAFSSIVGGEDNNIYLSDHAFIGGGQDLHVSGSKFSVAVGGFDNDITSGIFSTIGGGTQNSINRAEQAFIGGGGSNEIGSGAAGAAILGGTHNKLGANNEGRNSQSAILAGLSLIHI